MKILAVLFILISSAYAYGQGSTPPPQPLRVRTVDSGTNVLGVKELVFPNGTLAASGKAITITISGGAITSVFGRTGVVTATSGDYTWAQINKATSSLADITTRDFSALQGVPTTLSGYGITDAVPSTRTVNGHALTSNVSVTAGDVGLGNVENTALSTGNAGSATKLQSARTINGVSFDGTANISITASPGPLTRNASSLASFTVSSSDNYVAFTASSTAQTATLPAGSGMSAGAVIYFKDESSTATAGKKTIQRAGSDTIEGGTTWVLDVNGASIKLTWSGTEWKVF